MTLAIGDKVRLKPGAGLQGYFFGYPLAALPPRHPQELVLCFALGNDVEVYDLLSPEYTYRTSRDSVEKVDDKPSLAVGDRVWLKRSHIQNLMGVVQQRVSESTVEVLDELGYYVTADDDYFEKVEDKPVNEIKVPTKYTVVSTQLGVDVVRAKFSPFHNLAHDQFEAEFPLEVARTIVVGDEYEVIIRRKV